MAFLTVLKPVTETIRIPVDTTAVNTALGGEWTLAAGQTPRDVAQDSGVIYANTTLVVSPSFYSNRAISVAAGLRVSADLRVVNDVGANRQAQITIAVPGGGAGGGNIPVLLTIAADVTPAVHQIQFSMNGTITTVTKDIALPINGWMRVGFEILPFENIGRAYWNPASGDIGEGGNGNLQLQVEQTISSVGYGVSFSPQYFGSGFSNTSLAAPSAGMPNFSGVNDIIIELFEPPPFTAEAPSGTFFESLGTPYSRYKTTLAIHDLLTRARIV